MRAAAFGLLLGTALAAAQDAPRVLVYAKTKSPIPGPNGPVEVDVAFANPLASALDAEGRVVPVVWSRTDPIFRAAADEGRIQPPDAPTERDLDVAARALGCRYVLVATCERQGEGVLAAIRLTGAGRPYTTAQKGLVQVGGQGSLDLAVETAARTIAKRLSAEPFKGLPSRAGLPDTDPSPGQLPPVSPPEGGTSPATPPVPGTGTGTGSGPPLALADASAQADALMAEGKYRAAVLLLREAVDAAPFDAGRRRALIRAYSRAGMDAEALAEARAALAITSDPELRVEAARALIAAGRGEEARDFLNKALATTPGDPDLRRLVGELALREGDPARAVEHLDAALKTKPDARGFRLRAIARGLLGGEDGVKLDWDRAAALDPNPDPDLVEGDAFEIVDAALKDEGPTLRLLFQKALLKRDSSEAAEGIEAQERLASALLELTRLSGTSVKYAGSRDSRVLALNLLRQCLGELRAYVASGSEDDLSDARITLGESLRDFATAREAHAALRKPDARPR